MTTRRLATLMLFAGTLSVLALAGGMAWKSWKAPASDPTATPRRVDLSTSWLYSLDTNGRSPGNLPSPPDQWNDFDPHNSRKYADAIHDRYWLKKTFEIRYPFEYPAIVLGSISDFHRVYLNGKFIGGSDQPGDVAYYVFDPKLLNLEGPNTLLVSARTRPTLDPGLTWFSDVGTFLGDFQDVKRTVTRNQIRFQALRTAYFALSLVILAAFFGFAVFRRKKSRDQLVLSLIRLINDSADVTHTVGAVQERVARFLKARRSTLYVLDEGDDETLKATFILGSEQAQRHVRRAVRPSEGPIGYACSHRAPLFIENLQEDIRFKATAGSGYRTGSCMIFPLISEDRIVGVITFADKEGDQPFTRDDFAMALEVSKDLSLLLDNRRLQQSLKKLSG